MTKIWAHRGASGYAPENTLEAFELAARQGADGVELDVQMTKDGQLVVVHDEVIDRVSDGTGMVKDYTLEELRTFNFNKTHPEYKTAAIPTLAQVYELLAPLGLTVNVELKTGIYPYPGIEEAVVKETQKWGMEEKVIYSSFNHYSIQKIQKLAPHAQTGILFGDVWVDIAEYAKKLQVDALHPALYHMLMEPVSQEILNSQKKVHVWTVNEPEDMQMLINAGVDAIITNYPDRGVKLI